MRCCAIWPHRTAPRPRILCRHIAALPELADLLGEATALRALLGQRLDLNLLAPGTLALSENTPDEVHQLDRW